MICWTAKTLFEGLFPCPDYKITEAIKKHEDLHCFYNGKEMIIRELDLKKKVVKESEIYEDKFKMNKGKPYHLIYFNWNPLTKEEITKMMLNYT